MECNFKQQTKYRFFSVTLLSLILLLAAGCTSVQVGRDFDMQTFNSMVKQGVTSKAQVKDWLGVPNGTGVSLDKSGELTDEWMYFFGKGKMPNMESTNLKMLQIRFNKSGAVQSYNWSSGK